MKRVASTVASIFVALAMVLAAALPVAGTAQTVAPTTTARDAALQALASRLRLPLVDEVVTIFSAQLRRTLPAYVVDAAGQNMNLGAQWQRGNPSYDDAVRRVDAALADEEARAGPLLKLERGDLLLAVNVPWSRDDIAFVDATLGTDLGREAERALDAQAARQTIATLRRRVTLGAPGETIRRSFVELDAKATAQYGDAALTLLTMKGADPVRAARLQRLVEAVTVAPSDAIGARVVDRLSQRLLDAAFAQLPNILGSLRP